jgi:hypothetical protein
MSAAVIVLYPFQLLTECRSVEIHGHKLHQYPPIRVGDVDQRAGGVLLRDAKNRSDHKLVLSRQAFQIAKRNCAGQRADERLFPIVDARKRGSSAGDPQTVGGSLKQRTPYEASYVASTDHARATSTSSSRVV